MERTSRTRAPSSGSRVRPALLAPLLVAMVLAFAGIASPAHGAGPALAAAPARAEVNVTANGNFQLVFAGDSAQVAGQVLPASPTGKVPTGIVDLLPDYGSTVLSTSELSNNILPGLFVLIAPPLPLGTHFFRAAYRGDSNFAPKTIRFPINVLSGPQTKTSVTVSPAGSSAPGQAVTVKAQVSALTGPLTGTPLGAVHLAVDGIEVAAKPVGAGWTAAFTLSGLAVGQHVITAEYSHDAGDYFPSTSPPVTHTVAGSLPAAISTEFHSSHHGDIPLGQAVTVRAVIGSRAPNGATPAGPTPTGMVQFYDWNRKVGAPVKLVNGKAGFTYTSLSPGKHVLQAQYLGSSAYLAGFTPARTVNLLG